MAYLLLEMTIGITRLKKNLNKEFKAKPTSKCLLGIEIVREIIL
jgi:hypothetical protein